MTSQLLSLAVVIIPIVADNSLQPQALQTPPSPLGPFTLLKDYSGKAFFDGFEFFTGADPTKGYVDFVNKSTAFASGLARVDSKSSQVFMRVDHIGRGRVVEPSMAASELATNPLRRSVRVTSVDAYDPKNLSGSGTDQFGAILTVLDLAHIPTGCATWPAFWMNSGKGQWPQYGEIDIIEGVHENTQTQTTLHTSTGCQQTEVPTDEFTGNWTQHAGHPATNCYVHAYSPKGNLGCPIVGPPNSMGSPFNANGGGVYAMLWTHHPSARESDTPATNHREGTNRTGLVGHNGEKKMWYFDRNNIPADLIPHLGPQPPRNLTSHHFDLGEVVPNPSGWGKPYALFWSDKALCPAAHFEEQHLIFDITLCGGWAGNSFAAACPAFAPTNATSAQSLAACEAFVADNPAAFQEAYWAINSLKVFGATGNIRGSGAAGSGQNAVLPAVNGSESMVVPSPNEASGSSVRSRLLQEYLKHAGGHLRINVHRESPKYTNPNGPCSTTVTVDPEMSLQDVLTVISRRLGFTASRLEQAGVGVIATTAALLALPEQTVLSVYEDSPTLNAPGEELRRLRLQQDVGGSSLYDHETAEVLQALNTATLCPVDAVQAWNCTRCANASYFKRHFEFVPHEIRIVEAGGNADKGDVALMALVAPDHQRRWIVVSIRGTVDTSLEDWIDDLELWQEPFDHRNNSRFVGAKVHAGFLKSWRQLHANGILSAVEAAQVEWSGYQLIITGHSLGGSVAALMAAFLASTSLSTEKEERPLVYTFGQPRVGNQKFAEVYNELLPESKRVVHNHDLVPHYPFRQSYWGGSRYEYHHTPVEVWLFENSTARAIACMDGDGEDPSCCDSIGLLEWSGSDHTSYFAPLDAGPCHE